MEVSIVATARWVGSHIEGASRGAEVMSWLRAVAELAKQLARDMNLPHMATELGLDEQIRLREISIRTNTRAST